MCKINIDWLPLPHLNWGSGPQPRLVPWPESNRPPFGFQDNTQRTEPHQSGHFIYSWYKSSVKYMCCECFFPSLWLVHLPWWCFSTSGNFKFWWCLTYILLWFVFSLSFPINFCLAFRFSSSTVIVLNITFRYYIISNWFFCIKYGLGSIYVYVCIYMYIYNMAYMYVCVYICTHTIGY